MLNRIFNGICWGSFLCGGSIMLAYCLALSAVDESDWLLFGIALICGLYCGFVEIAAHEKSKRLVDRVLPLAIILRAAKAPTQENIPSYLQ